MTIYQNDYPKPRDYDTAAICRRGHVETAHVERRKNELPPRCGKCGAKIMTHCLSCSAPIQGQFSNTWGGYNPPQFCTSCGAPMPWSTREARLYELENILDEQSELTESQRLAIREQIVELNKPDISEEQQLKRWKAIKKISPALIDLGKEIVVSVTSELIQKQIGIKK